MPNERIHPTVEAARQFLIDSKQQGGSQWEIIRGVEENAITALVLFGTDGVLQKSDQPISYLRKTAILAQALAKFPDIGAEPPFDPTPLARRIVEVHETARFPETTPAGTLGRRLLRALPPRRNS